MRRYQEDVLHIPPDEVKAILLLDNAPAHPHADKLVSRDGRIRVVFLPPQHNIFDSAYGPEGDNGNEKDLHPEVP